MICHVDLWTISEILTHSRLREGDVGHFHRLHIGAAAENEGGNIADGGAHKGGHAVLILGRGGEDGTLQQPCGGIRRIGGGDAVNGGLLQKANGAERGAAVDLLPFLAAPRRAVRPVGTVGGFTHERFITVDDGGAPRKMAEPVFGMGSLTHAAASRKGITAPIHLHDRGVEQVSTKARHLTADLAVDQKALCLPIGEGAGGFGAVLRDLLGADAHAEGGQFLGDGTEVVPTLLFHKRIAVIDLNDQLGELDTKHGLSSFPSTSKYARRTERFPARLRSIFIRFGNTEARITEPFRDTS